MGSPRPAGWEPLRRMYLRFAEVELRCVVEAIAWYVQVLKSPDAPCL